MRGIGQFGVSVVLVLACAAGVEAQTARITGRVMDAQGMSVSGATVRLASSVVTQHEGRTGTDGDFSFEQLPVGGYTLRVEAPGFATWSQNVTATTSTAALDIMLQVSGLTESVSVVGRAPSSLVTPSVAGSRLGLTPLDTPASIQIISGDVVRERGDQTVQEAKSRAVGVTSQGDPGNGGNAVVARGFGGVGSVMQLFDGDQLFVGAGTVTFPFDPWTVERIEVLGGPSSVLYGNGAIDAAGPINASTSYRVDLSANRSGGWVRNNPSRTTALSASVRHEFSPTLTLTASEDFGHQRPGEYFGTPTINGDIDTRYRTVNYNVSDSDVSYRDNWTQFKVEWQASPSVRVRSGLQLLATNRHWRNAEEYVYNPTTRSIDRDSYIEIFHRQRQYGNRTDVAAASQVLGHANTLVAGFDYNFVSFTHTNNSPYRGESVTDLNNLTAGTFLNVDPTKPKYLTHTNRVAMFGEDRLVLSPKVSLVGGFRLDRYRVDRESLLNATRSDRTYTPVSGRGGLVYVLRPGLTAYGQVASATDTLGDIISNSPSAQIYDPTTGKQVEVGLKQSLWSDRAEWTVASYRIVKTKLLASVPSRPGQVQQIGSQSSKGIEATAAVRLPIGLRIEGNMAFLDARYDDFYEEVDGRLVSRAGNTPPSVPERSINLWAAWALPNDWQVRGGLRSVGQRFWDNTNTTKIPTYTVVDAGARKRLNNGIAIDLYLNNLTNALYATDFYYNGFAPQWMLGAPRSAEVALTVGF